MSKQRQIRCSEFTGFTCTSTCLRPINWTQTHHILSAHWCFSSIPASFSTKATSNVQSISPIEPLYALRRTFCWCCNKFLLTDWFTSFLQKLPRRQRRSRNRVYNDVKVTSVKLQALLPDPPIWKTLESHITRPALDSPFVRLTLTQKPTSWHSLGVVSVHLFIVSG